MLRQNNNQKGVAIFLALIIVTVFLSISLGLSIILLGQVKVAREIGYSGVAFYAADSGIEEIFYQDKECWKVGCEFLPYNCTTICEGLATPTVISVTLDNGATATTSFDKVSGEGTATSIGVYQKTQRAIEAYY